MGRSCSTSVKKTRSIVVGHDVLLILADDIGVLPVNAGGLRGCIARRTRGLARDPAVAGGETGVHIDGSGDTGAVVVFHHDAILDVIIKGDEHLALRVLAEGLPPVPSRPTKILRGVGCASLVRNKSTVPGDFF